MILNINDLSKFYGDDRIKFIKTIIRTNDKVMCIVPSNKMGSMMDLISNNLVPDDIQKIYIVCHFLDIITLEEMEIFINHLCESRYMKKTDFELIVNYNTYNEYCDMIYKMGVMYTKVYYHLNIKEVDMVITHTDRSALGSTLNIKGCTRRFEYSMIDYSCHYRRLDIIGV